MQISEKFKFNLPSRDTEDIADINLISDNFSKIDNNIPSTSDVTNNVNSAISEHNEYTSSHEDIRNLIYDLENDVDFLYLTKNVEGILIAVQDISAGLRSSFSFYSAMPSSENYGKLRISRRNLVLPSINTLDGWENISGKSYRYPLYLPNGSYTLSADITRNEQYADYGYFKVRRRTKGSTESFSTFASLTNKLTVTNPVTFTVDGQYEYDLLFYADNIGGFSQYTKIQIEPGNVRSEYTEGEYEDHELLNNSGSTSIVPGWNNACIYHISSGGEAANTRLKGTYTRDINIVINNIESAIQSLGSNM